MSKQRNFTVEKRPPGATIQNKIIRTEVTKQMKRIATKHVKVRENLTKNWSQENRPKFTIEEEQNQTSITVRVKLSAENARQAKKSVYQLLDEGTDVRYATMTLDFKAKTKPRSLVSGPGQGGLLYVDTRKPHPGIEAREFDETVNDMLNKEMQDAIEQGYEDGFKKVERASR